MGTQIKQFEGYLIIHVNNYLVDHMRSSHLNEGHNHYGEYVWAVGNNERGKYVSNMHLDKLRKFLDFDEAVKYIFERKRQYKEQVFQLVYCVESSSHEVSTLDQIVAIDVPIKERQERAAVVNTRISKFIAQGLTEREARSANRIYEDIKLLGLDRVKNEVSERTFRRYISLFKKSGIISSELQSDFWKHN